MKLRKLSKIVIVLLILSAVAVALTSISHPIMLKWVTGSARIIGRPIKATIYTNGHITNDVKVFAINKYWRSSGKADSYLIKMPGNESIGKPKFYNINLKEKWIGKPTTTSKNDYDFILGQLFQSETGGRFTPFEDDMKGFNFDPQLSFTEKQIKFNLQPSYPKYDSVRIELR